MVDGITKHANTAVKRFHNEHFPTTFNYCSLRLQDFSRFIDTLITYKYMQHEVNKIQKRSNKAIIINFFFTYFNKKNLYRGYLRETTIAINYFTFMISFRSE